MMQCKQVTATSVQWGRQTLRGLVSVGLLLACVAGAAHADNIDKKLLSEGPKVIDYLKKHGYHNVGVLPFRVALVGKPPRFNVGDLNANMAVRLENTLVLLDDPHKPVGILHKAGIVAARGHKRGYAEPKQRSALFEVDYQLPWGDSKVKADVFLTGDVKFAADNHSATVTIKAFDRHSKEPTIIHQFTARTDRSMLGDSGQSFRLTRRGTHRRDADDDELAADSARDQETGNPAGGGNPPAPGPTPGNVPNDPPAGNAPVTLTVLYDGSPVSLSNDPANRGARRVRLPRRRGPGNAPSTIQGPQANQGVVLALENNSPTDTYAVVLKVNGHNTLYQETEDALHCTKWVLDPAKGGQPTRYEIKGFYLKEAQDGNNLLPFRVLSEEESQQREQSFDLPDHLGLIEMHVFKQGKDSGDDAHKVSMRGLSPRDHRKSKSRSLAEYQKRLQEKTHVHRRGDALVHAAPAHSGKTAANHGGHKRLSRGGSLIDAGEATKGDALQVVSFDNPQEVAVTILRYYTPGSASPSNPGPTPGQ